jgi:hypothetical protein
MGISLGIMRPDRVVHRKEGLTLVPPSSRDDHSGATVLESHQLLHLATSISYVAAIIPVNIEGGLARHPAVPRCD